MIPAAGSIPAFVGAVADPISNNLPSLKVNTYTVVLLHQ